MQASAHQLMQKDHSSFQSRTAESSDSKKVTAAASAGAESKTYEVKALAKLKDVVNAAKAGVTAIIVTDDSTGNKKLELIIGKTGTNQAF